MSNDFYHSAILPHAGIIIKICRAYTNSPEDFEDFYQEVCLQIWKSRKNFKADSEWSTWVYRITLNVCLTLTRKKRPVIAPIQHQHAYTAQGTKPSTIEEENIQQLYTAIKTLSEIDRAIILLYLEEKSYKEIAQIMGTNTSHIGVRINRIKKRLKTILDGKVN